MKHTNRYWKIKLSPLQYLVLREGKNEQPSSGSLLYVKGKGRYKCAGCNNLLFDANNRIENINGYLSFSISAKDSLKLKDNQESDNRNKVYCEQCNGYIGYCYPQASMNSGQRYEVNSSTLNF